MASSAASASIAAAMAGARARSGAVGRGSVARVGSLVGPPVESLFGIARYDSSLYASPGTDAGSTDPEE